MKKIITILALCLLLSSCAQEQVEIDASIEGADTTLTSDINDGLITFEDEILETAIKKAMRVNEPITRAQALKIDTLNLFLYNRDIKSLVGLEEFENLESLDMKLANLENIHVLAALDNLIELNLTETGIKDISPLASLNKLKRLYIASNPIEGFEVLANLTELEELELRNTGIQSLDILENLNHLQYLNLSLNPIESLEPISKLENLKSLNISHNETLESGDLSVLANIATLNITGMHLGNPEFIDSMKKLESLTLGYDSVESIKSIASYQNLTDLKLYLDDESVSDLNWISEMPQLKSLETVKGNVEDWSFLSNLKALESFATYKSTFSNINLLSENENLHVLILNDLPMETFEGVSLLPNLERLMITDIADVSIKELFEVSGFKSVYIEGCDLTSEEVERAEELGYYVEQ